MYVYACISVYYICILYVVDVCVDSLRDRRTQVSNRTGLSAVINQHCSGSVVVSQGNVIIDGRSSALLPRFQRKFLPPSSDLKM